MKWFDVSAHKHGAEDETQFSKEISDAEGIRKFMEVSVAAGDEVKEEDGLNLFFTISTPHVDRDGDVIYQDGWDLNEYKKNPVVLWAHDASSLPVARAKATYLEKMPRKNDGEDRTHLMSVAEFPSRDLYPFGNMVGRLYKNGYLHGASVGFLPMDYEINREREGFSPIDFKSQRLLEWSAVPVPSNPEGLVQARSAGIDLSPMVSWAEKILDGEGALILPKHLIEEIRKNAGAGRIFSTGSTLQLDMFGKKEADVKVKTVITYQDAHPDGSSKAPEDEEWNGPRAVADADSVKQLYDMCTYYRDDGETKGDYKLPHHHPDGSVVLRGVQAAMAALMGARGGVDIPSSERKGVYNHLAEHYRAFDKDPPEFKDVECIHTDWPLVSEGKTDTTQEDEKPLDKLVVDTINELEEETVEIKKDLEPETQVTEEASKDEEVKINDDDLRRLAKATFERRVLSLTQELKDLVGQISTGDDR